MAQIEFHNVHKTYRVKAKITGPFAGLRGFFSRRTKEVRAVDDISFEVGTGELVGYLGPNGAGKSTTIKMLTGILMPSAGTVRTLGLEPFRHRTQNALNIGAVFGQRTQLWWDLPVEDSFDLNRRLYRIPEALYRENRDRACELLGVGEFYHTPVRQLSLGQRMRAEIGAALLHDPKILFLDEPTIGLDVTAKDIIRKYIRRLNQEKRTTILLTTHDMTDVEEICDRLVIIDLGKKLYDGPLDTILRAYQTRRSVVLDLAEDRLEVSVAGFETLGNEGPRRWRLQFDRNRLSTPEALARLTQDLPVHDLSLEDRALEEVIRDIYRTKTIEGPPAAGGAAL